MILRILLVFLMAIQLSACVQMGTKGESYPLMYSDAKPLSMVIVPAINETTAADAGDLLYATVTQPFANHGYYVLPVPVVADIFRREGILEGSQIKGMPMQLFKENFGADSVLFMTITEWDKNYAIISANVVVDIEYVLLSTTTNDVLWSYKQKVVLDTSGSSGNLLVDLVATAITTAVTDYVPIASQVHTTAANAALPYGQYHPRSGLDAIQRTVLIEAKASALAED
ncbi:MAG TPA: hypothetical protein EYQ00_03340 [Dehalococcoidia bacterium]|nr:hypothetical protein [Dehalococcoidia bacterium]